MEIAVEVRGHIQFDKAGFLVIPKLLADSKCDALAAELSALHEQKQRAIPRFRGGLRNVLQLSPQAASIASSVRCLGVVEELIGGNAFPVRAILFDKTAAANWAVSWHQDLVIAVEERIETPGFGPWSVKEGVVHVQPPRQILEQMVTMRLHLDDCAADNGALRVLPGSHLDGELSFATITRWMEHQTPKTCAIPKGGALLMRPLLLHASAPAKNPSHRRVLHVEYAATDLTNGLKWSKYK